MNGWLLVEHEEERMDDGSRFIYAEEEITNIAVYLKKEDALKDLKVWAEENGAKKLSENCFEVNDIGSGWSTARYITDIEIRQ